MVVIHFDKGMKVLNKFQIKSGISNIMKIVKGERKKSMKENNTSQVYNVE